MVKRGLGISYSQFEEDRIVAKILSKEQITYIDVGANHPIKFNNTYLFYRNGGKGIIVEPNPMLCQKSEALRTRDEHLNIGLGEKRRTIPFYIINPDVSSTFVEETAKALVERGCVLVETKKVKVETLADIFQKYVPGGRVDILSVDTEGYDYRVLKGNDWEKYRARLIIVESREETTKKLLKRVGYKEVAKTVLNTIYIDRR